jgi:hypothetical protein
MSHAMNDFIAIAEEQILDDLEHLAEQAGGHVAAAWRKIHAGHGYDGQQQQNTPEDPVSVIAELKQDALDLAAKFGTVDEAAADKLAALEGNPVADALLEALHVPPADLEPVVAMLKTLGALVPKPEPQPA